MGEMDLNHHYRVLKQFLDISDDSGSRNKPNSTRAARAREKLLKLSAAQFKELSTDVYDELRRRIDESRGEPDYLLPKSSFHPKRNQARQKLSSLPQTRFKDLVSDISFEIERRDLHTEKVTTIPDTDNASVDKANDSYEQASQVVQATTEPTVTSNASSPIKDLDAARKDSAASQNQTIGIQSKTVVPTKANLTWSSDEEEDEEVVEKQKPVDRDIQNTTDETRHSEDNILSNQLKAEHSQKDELISQLNSRISAIERENFSLEEKYRLLQDDYEFSITQNKTLSQELEKLSEEKTNRSVSDNEHSKRIEQLKSTISTLEAENQSLKSATPNGSAKGLNGALSPNSDKGHRNENLKKDMAVFFDRLSRLESAPVQQQGSYVELKNDLIKWQKKYEEARSKTLSTDITQAIMSHEQLKSFVSSYGLISIKLVADLQALVESFILYLNGKSFETDILFEKISKISILANEIATQAEYNQPFNSNEHSICLREAVSYALSATRYYAVYSSILPKIVVERSVGEICFTLCDLITVTKLQENSSDSRSVQPATNAVKPSLTSGLEQDFGARPLKMANRLRESSLSASNSPAPPQDEQSSPFNTPDVENSGHSRNLFGGNAPASGFLRKISPFGGVRSTSAPKDPNPETKSTPKSSGSSTDLNEVYPAREVSLVQPTTNEAPSSTSSLLTKKAESPKSKSISALASKFEQASSDVDLNKSNKSSPRSISPGIKQLTSKLDSNNEMSTSQTSSPSSSPYKKKNILDKVRHFEAEQDTQAPSHSRQSSSSSFGREGSELEKDSEPSIKSSDAKSTLNEPFEAASRIPQTTPEHESTKNIDNVNGLVNKKIRNNSGGSVDSGRGKGLFQSIRDRLTSDNDHKIPDESTYSEEGNSDNEKVELSTDKLITSTAETTPSKDVEDEGDENASDFSPVKATDRGFFQSIKDRLTTNTLEEDQNQKSISSASSDSTVHIDSKNSLDSGSSNGIGSRKLSNEVVPGVRSLPFDAHQPGLAINYSVPGQGKENGARSMSNESGGSLKSLESSKSSNSGKSEALKSSLATEKAQVVKKVNYSSDTKTNNIDDKATESSEEEEDSEEEEETEEEDEDSEESQARQRQEYRKSMAAATFNIDLFDIDDPDNTLTQVLLYLEHQTVQVITTIQSLLSAIKKPNATRGDLREKSQAITVVISQMTEATNTSMNQTRNSQLKEHGSWVVKSLEDCNHRMNILCKPNSDKNDSDFADKNFKQRLAGISFDIAKCTKELVKTVEEASLKEDIANLDARLEHADDLT